MWISDVAIKYILVCCVLCAETPFILFNLQSYKSGLVSDMYFNCRQMYTGVCAQRITSAALLQLCLFQNSMLCCCVLYATRTIRYDKITEILTIHRHIIVILRLQSSIFLLYWYNISIAIYSTSWWFITNLNILMSPRHQKSNFPLPP